MDKRLRHVVRAIVIVGALLAYPAASVAQETALSGVVTDESKAALPGVTVTATSATTGRTFVGVTSATGAYRLIGLPSGRYNLQADLSGFSKVLIKDIDLLVGQNATIPVILKLASVQESVTVTGAAPLVDTEQARVAGNVDRRQMEEIPIAGRDWKQLATLVKGITLVDAGNRPGVSRDAAFQLNLDGQNITNGASSSGFGEPIISRDAIAEYQIITNLFDVTMGRSTGIQVQAVTKAGSNIATGSMYGFFRDSSLNAPDAYAGHVLPYSNQQVGMTLGGPIVKDKVHFFAAYEGERAPNTLILTPSALPGQRFELPTEQDQRKPLARVDYQLSPRDHVTVRVGYSRSVTSDATTSVPSADISRLYDSNFTAVNWARSVRPNVLQELKVNYFHYHWLYGPAEGVPSSPTYRFPGLSLGVPSNYPQNWFEDFTTTRYDLSWSKGSHAFKIGTEVRFGKDSGNWEKGVRGTLSFSKLPGDAATRFPASAALDPSQWDFSGLDATATTFQINYYHDHYFDIPRPMVAAWIGDTWRVTHAVTLNLGARYDVAWDDFISPGVEPTSIPIDSGYALFGAEDVGYRSNIRDLKDIAPRVGFAWSPSSSLVIHGGTGLYYSAMSEQPVDQQLYNGQNVIGNTYTNDGLPGFVQDPTRGVTADQVLSGAVPLQPQSIVVIAKDMRMPYTWQNMIGFQKQLSNYMGFDADLVQYRGYHEDSQRDPNLFYDAATGLPLNPNVYDRPNPAYSSIHLNESNGRSDYMGLAMSFTRRYHNNFQFGATYTLMFYKHDTGIGSAGFGAMQLNPFDIGTDWATSRDFQRNTLRLNGVWNLPMGLSFSALYGYGSPNPSFTTSTNVDPLGLGSNRVRSDLSIIPRNNFYGDAYQTLDLHLAKDIHVGRVKLTGIAELFNTFNYAQYSYNTLETSAAFGTRNGTVGSPRSGQLAFRVSF
jgi:Carboxypeptidase regulatory-like domain